ncbi:MAG: pantoate--beta-alanine ligase [Taibaiella sp.]|nr:pantoate--beta-alanine ligase [Taibaiella sp.]
MVVFRKSAELSDYLHIKRSEGNSIGFVPTMGALHKGHISLVEASKKRGLITVCSIFVNPTQFNDKSDLAKYPVTTEADLELLLGAGCDVVFLPDEKEVYPQGAENTPVYDFGSLEAVLEGAMRPGHFRGVGQVVGRLLEIVQPQALFLGRKDYQQCLVIADLVKQMHLATEVVRCDTRREPDGLAMSSRNRRLTEPQRTVAGLIYQCLVSIQSKNGATPFAIVQKECDDILRKKGFEPEYIALANADTLSPLANYDAAQPMVALIAARIGDTRLIDNIAVV